jgi:hypothetical protein
MTRNEAAQILGISPQANENAIKKAFRKKAMKLHPDRNKAPNARSQFIQVHEAYEYLNDLATGRTTETYSRSTYKTQSRSSSKFRSPNHKHRHYADPYEHMSREEFEERYERAKSAAFANQNRKDAEIHSNALDEYQNTWRHTFAKYMAGIGLVLAILFTLDFLLGTVTEEISSSETEITSISDNQNTYYYLTIHHIDISLPKRLHYYLKKKDIRFYIKHTRIFKDIITVDFKANNQQYSITPRYSSYESFPLVPLLMLFPLLSFWLERPTFNFVFFAVYYNLYVFPIITVILLFHDGRLLRLFGL